MGNLDALVRCDVRNVLCHHMQQHDALMDDLVVLEIMQQGHRHYIGSASQINGRARNARLIVDLDDEASERQRIALKLLQHELTAAPPCPHEKEDQSSDHQRDKPTLENFHEIGGNE